MAKQNSFLVPSSGNGVGTVFSNPKRIGWKGELMRKEAASFVAARQAVSKDM
jgi:hypothetical protein